MDIGTGIAIAGAWVFAAATAIAPNVSGWGMWVGIFCAASVTAALGVY